MPVPLAYQFVEGIPILTFASRLRVTSTASLSRLLARRILRRRQRRRDLADGHVLRFLLPRKSCILGPAAPRKLGLLRLSKTGRLTLFHRRFVFCHSQGFGIILSLLAMGIVHGPFSYPTKPTSGQRLLDWLPDPFMRIWVANIHRCKHGSDSESYDRRGQFQKHKFEEVSRLVKFSYFQRWLGSELFMEH